MLLRTNRFKKSHSLFNFRAGIQSKIHRIKIRKIRVSVEFLWLTVISEVITRTCEQVEAVIIQKYERILQRYSENIKK